MIHNVDVHRTEHLPLVVINFASDDIYLLKGETMGFMQIQSIEISEIMIETSTEPSSIMYEDDDKEVLNNQEGEVEKESLEKKFITSPVDIDVHRKVELQDADITDEQQKAFKDLCTEFSDIFSTDSGDIGKTPLLEVEIDTGDSLPITQKPYTLPLKHTEWVQRELEILEKAGVIVRSVSPWASPIVVVPKRTVPGEPPKQRSCVDYRALNSLLPLVKKAFSKAKGILTLVPLPKIDEIYARLKGSNIYSTFEMRSGYYHMVLSEKSRPKSAFVSSFGKWEFKRCSFGLAQAPTYFQRLVNEVLLGLTFAFGYLDDILVYSPDMETHLNTLLEPKIRYMGNDINIISLEAIKNLYEIMVTNLKLAREKGDPQEQPIPTKLQPGDTVLIQNHIKGPFDPKYIGDYRVVSLKGNQVEIQPAVGGPTEMKHIKHVKYILPADRYIDQLPDYSRFGRRTMLRINPDQIPDLHWKLVNMYHTTNIGQTEIRNTSISLHDITAKTLDNMCKLSLNTETCTSQSRHESIVCSVIPIHNYQHLLGNIHYSH